MNWVKENREVSGWIRLVGCWRFMCLQHLRSGWVSTCDSVHSWQLYCAAPLGDQATSNMTRCFTQSHYPDNEWTSSCPILLMLITRLGGKKDQFDKSLVWLDWELNSRSPNRLIRPPRPVSWVEQDGDMRESFVNQTQFALYNPVIIMFLPIETWLNLHLLNQT